jgi:hypothetical protein
MTNALFYSLWSLNSTDEIEDDIDMMLDCFENHLEAEKKAEKKAGAQKSRIDQQLLDRVSNLARTWRMLQSIDLYRPAFKAENPTETCVVGSERLFWRLFKPPDWQKAGHQ